jgi:hypothetical protein
MIYTYKSPAHGRKQQYKSTRVRPRVIPKVKAQSWVKVCRVYLVYVRSLSGNDGSDAVRTESSRECVQEIESFELRAWGSWEQGLQSMSWLAANKTSWGIDRERWHWESYTEMMDTADSAMSKNTSCRSIVKAIGSVRVKAVRMVVYNQTIQRRPDQKGWQCTLQQGTDYSHQEYGSSNDREMDQVG